MSNSNLVDSSGKNVESGIPLTASPAILHRKLVSYLMESPNMPLDVFEKGEVVREEHYCVPAYQFSYNATASFICQVGNTERVQEQSYEKGFLSDEVSHVITTKDVTKWTPMSSSVSLSGVLFTPGEKKLAPQIQKLYMQLDPNHLSSQLIGSEELDFPPDAETYGYNLNQVAAFNEYVMPLVNKKLQQDANNSLAGKKIKDFSMGGSNIQKDIIRVFFGLYRIVFKYDDKEYSVWVTGDGENAFHEGMPEDTQRKKTLEDKQFSMREELSCIPEPKTGVLTLGIVASVIAGIILAIQVHPIFLAVGLAGIIIFSILRSKARNPYELQWAETEGRWQKEINDFDAQLKNVLQQFKSQKKALHGVYEGVSGDASAF